MHDLIARGRCAVIGLVLSALPGVAAAGPHGPNIVFVLTDDQGYGDLGRHGNPVLRTPNLDRLHDESVRFDNFCVAASCSPTRASLMTGMHHVKVGVTHTIVPREHLSLKATTLPQILKTAGYATACIGKWHLGQDGDYAPGRRGFDFVTGNPRHFQNGKYREDILFDEAMGFIERSAAAGRPFFCYLATWSPHTPLIAPEEFIAPYRDKVDENTAAFFGMVANIDWNVGRLLARLRALDLDNRTVLVFMNDNGGTCGIDTWNAGMRGCKCTAWPGGCRAMSFWRWPGTWAPRVVNDLTAHVDVLPTFAALAGASVPPAVGAELEGRSLLPLLEGEGDPWFAERLLCQHVSRWPSGLAAAHRHSMAGVRQRDLLLLRSRPCEDLGGGCSGDRWNQCNALRRVEQGAATATYTRQNAQFHWGVTPGDGFALYDVRKDPACNHNLAPAQPDTVKRLLDAYGRWWDAVYPAMLEAGGDRGPLQTPAPRSPGGVQRDP